MFGEHGMEMVYLHTWQLVVNECIETHVCIQTFIYIYFFTRILIHTRKQTQIY